MGIPANIGALLTPGLRNEFNMAYQPSYKGFQDRIDPIIATVTSDKQYEIFSVTDSATHPVRWADGTIIPAKNFGSKQFTVYNRDFGRRVYMPRNWDDDQSGQSFSIARQLGGNWGLLPERIFMQYIQDSTDNELLPSVPNSADGNALYLSSTRYGSSGGNVVTQTGSSTSQQIITDLFSVKRRFNEFQSTESQPLIADSLTNNMTVFHGTQLTLVMQQAVLQTRPHSVVSSTGAAVTNILQEGTINITPVSTQRISTAYLYCFLNGLPNEQRPVFRMVRKGVNEAQGNWQTSDHTRDTGQPYVQFDSREGWGSAEAYGTIRVS